jgi:enoyl-CoA hydratase/carnithine racemase
MSLGENFTADGLLRLTLDRPQAANALDSALHGALVAALERAGRDPAVRAVLLGAAGGRVFSAGADLREDLGAEAGQIRRTLLLRSLLALLDCPRPVVTALRGKAVGAGVMLALLADEVVMEEGASFFMPEIGLGMPSPIGATIVAERGGRQAAHALVQAQRRLAAAEALHWRLADAVHADAELDAAAAARAAALGGLDPRAYAINKSWMNAPLREALGRAAACASAAAAKDIAHAH